MSSLFQLLFTVSTILWNTASSPFSAVYSWWYGASPRDIDDAVIDIEAGNTQFANNSPLVKCGEDGLITHLVFQEDLNDFVPISPTLVRETWEYYSVSSPKKQADILAEALERYGPAVRAESDRNSILSVTERGSSEDGIFSGEGDTATSTSSYTSHSCELQKGVEHEVEGVAEGVEEGPKLMKGKEREIYEDGDLEPGESVDNFTDVYYTCDEGDEEAIGAGSDNSLSKVKSQVRPGPVEVEYDFDELFEKLDRFAPHVVEMKLRGLVSDTLTAGSSSVHEVTAPEPIRPTRSQLEDMTEVLGFMGEHQFQPPAIPIHPLNLPVTSPFDDFFKQHDEWGLVFDIVDNYGIPLDMGQQFFLRASARIEEESVKELRESTKKTRVSNQLAPGIKITEYELETDHWASGSEVQDQAPPQQTNTLNTRVDPKDYLQIPKYVWRRA